MFTGHDIVGTVSLRHVYEIAKIKSQDPAFAGIPLENVCKTIIGSAKSLGIEVIRWQTVHNGIVYIMYMYICHDHNDKYFYKFIQKEGVTVMIVKIGYTHKTFGKRGWEVIKI